MPTTGERTAEQLRKVLDLGRSPDLDLAYFNRMIEPIIEDPALKKYWAEQMEILIRDANVIFAGDPAMRDYNVMLYALKLGVAIGGEYRRTQEREEADMG